MTTVVYTFTPTDDSSSSHSCPAGEISTATGAGACTPCLPTLTSNDNHTACVCGPGFYLFNNSYCRPECALGFEEIAESVCQPCPVGSYGDTPGVCTQCPQLMTTANDSSTTVGNCDCIGGTVRVSGDVYDGCTIACGPGFYVSATAECLVSADLCSVVIGLNAAQIVAQVGRLSLPWPPFVQRLFDVLAAFNFNIELVAPECAIQTANAFKLRYVLSLLVPVYFAALLANGYLLFVMYTYVQSVNPVSVYNVRRSVLQTALQLALILYLPLASAVLEFFDCVPVEIHNVQTNGETEQSAGVTRVVASSPEVECGGAVWRSALWAAVLFTVLYPLGIPAAFASVLTYAKHSLGSEDFVLNFGYLTNRYSYEHSLWEVAVLLRKLGLVLILTFVTSSPYIQSGVGVMWILSSVLVHVKAAPYSFEDNNALETGCLFAIAAVLQFGVMLQDERLSTTAGGLVVVAVLLALAVAVAAVARREYSASAADLADARLDPSTPWAQMRVSTSVENLGHSLSGSFENIAGLSSAGAPVGQDVPQGYGVGVGCEGGGGGSGGSGGSGSGGGGLFRPPRRTEARKTTLGGPPGGEVNFDSNDPTMVASYGVDVDDCVASIGPTSERDASGRSSGSSGGEPHRDNGGATTFCPSVLDGGGGAEGGFVDPDGREFIDVTVRKSEQQGNKGSYRPSGRFPPPPSVRGDCGGVGDTPVPSVGHSYGDALLPPSVVTTQNTVHSQVNASLESDAATARRTGGSGSAGLQPSIFGSPSVERRNSNDNYCEYNSLNPSVRGPASGAPAVKPKRKPPPKPSRVNTASLNPSIRGSSGGS